MQFGESTGYVHVRQSYAAEHARNAAIAKREFFAPGAAIAPSSDAVLNIGLLKASEGNIKPYDLAILNIHSPAAPRIAGAGSEI